MLTQVADGVLVHPSAFMQTNTVVVQGPQGVLLIDPGVTAAELRCLSADLDELGQPVALGFSTHPHWDHLLWHDCLGTPPRHGTARCAADALAGLSEPGVKERIAAHLPPEFGEHVPLDLLGEITGLPPGAAQVPWDGPRVRILEHEAHATGHAALLVEDRGVLVAGDMLSDLLIPMLDLEDGDEPVDDYLAGLRLLEAAAGHAAVVVPGHGTVGGAGEVLRRIDLDRTYVQALLDGRDVSDPRLDRDGGTDDPVPGIHAGQVEGVTALREGARALG
jgi:glyoxylase-like metal-dependent hydrolase (beta-lactamase superfamily II)